MTDHQLTDLDVQLATIKETARTERQKNLLNLFGTILNAVIGIANAFLILHNTSQVETVKQAAVVAADASVVVAETAHNRDKSIAALEQKADANLMQWKAFQTKDGDDMNRAVKALEGVGNATPDTAK